MGSGDTEGEEVWQELRKNSEKGTDYSDNVQKGGILNLALSKKFGEGTLSSTMVLIPYAALPDYADYESDESISFVIRDRQDERDSNSYLLRSPVSTRSRKNPFISTKRRIRRLRSKVASLPRMTF